ncbi:hypothetical protein STRDD04_00525 [Streptococcus sp. DD04]|nr:hypothetical protein STRDD04_00525 [Streptococcus sp. DD04]
MSYILSNFAKVFKMAKTEKTASEAAFSGDYYEKEKFRSSIKQS